MPSVNQPSFPKSNSEFAEDKFKEINDWAKAYGRGQYQHFIRTSTEDFPKNALLAAFAMAGDDILESHARCVERGVIDRHDDREIKMSALTLGGQDALSVRFPDGDNILYVIKRKENRGSEISAIAWRDVVPDELMDELKERVREGASFDSLRPLADRIGRYSGYRSADEFSIYGGHPLSIDEIKASAENDGIDRVVQAAGIGLIYKNHLIDDFFQYEGYSFDPSAIHYAERTLASFTASPVKVTRTAEPHAVALAAGEIWKLYASTCALAMGYQIKQNLGKIEGIVDASDRLGLSSETVFTYNDTDIRIYAERHGDIDLLFHHNIDRFEGCAYAIALTRENGMCRSVDVYLTTPWYLDFKARFGMDSSDPAPPDSVSEFLSRGRKDDVWIDEDELLAAVANGIIPEKGKTFSYNLASGQIGLTPLAVETGFLNYLPLMLEYDHKTIVDATNGEFQEYGTDFAIRDKAAGSSGKFTHIEPEDYLAGLTSKRPSAMPGM